MKQKIKAALLKIKGLLLKLFPPIVSFPLFSAFCLFVLHIILAFAGFCSGSLVLGELTLYSDLYFDFWDFDVWAINCLFPLNFGVILLYHACFAFWYHLFFSLLNFDGRKLRARCAKK